jgi:tetratricopeptide (TPR) repeat protein
LKPRPPPDRGTTFRTPGPLTGQPYTDALGEPWAADFDTLCLQGSLAHQAGQHERAIGLLARAVRLKGTAAAYRSLGDALRAVRRYTEAFASYNAAVTLQPDLADAHCASAAVLQELGRPREALASAHKAIALEPGRAEAHNHCGIALRDLRQPLEALASFDRAITLVPDYLAAHNNRGIVLHELQRAADAVASFDRAIALQPDVPELHNNRGNALRDLRRFDEAVASFDRAIALRADYAVAHTNRGATLQELERFAAALASHERAIALEPGFAMAHSNRAIALTGLGRREEALDSCDRAIALQPRFAPAHNNRGLTLQALKRHDEAVASYQRAVALQPDLAEAHNNLATVLRDLGRAEEALQSLECARRLRPGITGLHMNLGNTLRDLQHPEEALASYDRALLEEPDRPALHCNRGAALADLNRVGEAIASFDRAIALDGAHAEAHFNKSRSLLLSGQLEEGFRLLEWRSRLAAQKVTRSPPRPLWLGDEDIAGKRVLLHSEQGLGDTIQFCRYARLVEARGAHVVLAVQPQLRQLLRGLSPTIELIAEGTLPDEFDYHCPLLSLPLAFRTTLGTIPAEGPYLAADPERAERWRQVLGSAGFRVGVCWQGTRNPIDIGRSFALDRYRALATIPGVRLISLQKGHGVEQLPTRPPAMAVEELGDFDGGVDAFLDTAAVMRNLDLVITSDTAVAHLAGALGCPAWVALKHAPDWRWLLERDDSPWYPTLRLFRQPRRGDWDSVFSAIRAALLDVSAAAAAA